MLQKILLSCGIIAPLVYFGTDLLAGKLIKGYSFSAQSMSELGAAGSPTRPLVVALTLVASVLMIAFGIGVWQAAGPAILPSIVAGLILGNAFAGLAATLFFPNRIGERPAFGTPEVLLMFLSVLCSVLAIDFRGSGVPRLDAHPIDHHPCRIRNSGDRTLCHGIFRGRN
jgi:H+/Cl- antiporter ClcA